MTGIKKSFRDAAPVWAAFSLVVVWLGAAAAGAYTAGMDLIDFMGAFSKAMERPFALRWTAQTIPFILGALAVYACAIFMYYSTRENKRPGEEHGSAKWGSVRELNRKYRDKDPEKNVILTQRLQMGLDSRKHRRNLLQIIVGGSGSGKTRFVVKPNLYLANTSYIVTDPKSEVLRSVGALLLQKGYTLRVLDLIDPEHSDCYNPFRYIRKDSDVFRLIDNFIKNTTPKKAANSDPFWEKSETALDSALMLYLLHEAPPEEQNMEMILTMIEYGSAKEDDDDFQSPLDLLFEALEEEQPEHIAVRQYKIFKQAAGKTAKSILVQAAVRLSAFTLPEVQRITSRDDMELDKLGSRKQAVFCVIPDSNDASLNFLVGMLYTQAFQELYYQADRNYGGSLPIPVRLMFDEFANIALPDGYVNAPLYNSIDTVKNLPVDYARYGAFLREQGEIQRFSFYNTVKSLASPINRNVLTVYADQEVDFVLKNSQQVNIAESSGKYNSSAVSYYKRSTDGDKVVYFIELNLSDVGSSRHFVEFTTTSDTVQPHYSFWFGNPLTKEATATGGTFTINIFSPNRSSANVSVSAPSSVPQRSWVKSVTINRTSTYGDANINSAVLTITLDSGRALSGLRTSNSRITYGASLMYTNASPVKGSYKANLMSVSWKTGISASSRYSYSGKMTVNYLYAFGA